MAVAAGTDGIGQQQAVQPAMDDAVAGAQGYPAPMADEGRQLAVGLHIDRLRIGGGVAEGLHHHVGAEAQAGQVLQLVAGHGTGGVLAAHGGHLGLAVGAGADALAFRQTTGTPDHLLRHGEAFGGVDRGLGQAEDVGGGQSQELPRPGGQTTADDQVDAPAGPDLVQQHLALERELGDDFLSRGAVLHDLAVVGEDVDDIAHLQLGDIEFDRQ